VQAWIVADDQERPGFAWLGDDFEKLLRAGIIKALVDFCSRPLVKRGGDQFSGFLRPLRGRDQGQVREETMVCQVSAHDWRISASALHQFAIAVALAGLGALGFGVAK